MEDKKHPLEYVSEAQDLVDLNDFMADPDFEECLGIVLMCIAKPDLPPAQARLAMIKMQGYAFKFKMMGQVYMTIKVGKAGTDENKKKNVYFSASDLCQEMANTLKYVVREAF